MTSNPTIFEQAIGGSTDYEDDLNRLSMSPKTDQEVYEILGIQDVREAADLFRPLYDSTGRERQQQFPQTAVKDRDSSETDITPRPARR